jgi:hypothetical protein
MTTRISTLEAYTKLQKGWDVIDRVENIINTGNHMKIIKEFLDRSVPKSYIHSSIKLLLKVGGNSIFGS